MVTFTKESLHIDDIVVYLKNERTGSSTIRKCKFIGQVVGFTDVKVKIRRFSQPDIFVTPEEIQDFGVDTVYPDDVVHIIISKYDEDITKTLGALNCLVDRMTDDNKLLLGKWFCTLEDEGADPWSLKECVELADKYGYTEEDYKKYLSTIA